MLRTYSTYIFVLVYSAIDSSFKCLTSIVYIAFTYAILNSFI